jgi:uncharacterized repeat protein (TIGR01451 family)
MNFVGLQTGRNTRSAPSQVASRRNRARYRLAAQTLEQCENRVLLATILGAAQSFAVLGASTVTNTGASAIVGNVGVSPGTAITGFPPGIITGGALQAGNSLAAQAHADLVTAYGEIAGEVSPPANDLTGTNLGGLTLAPGVYHFDTSASLAEATTLTLNANGDPNARFDFQIGTTLITGSTSAIKLINGAEAQNVYFQVGSSATLGTGTLFEGNILADQSVTLTTGATMVDGRALALVAAVTMDTNQVTQPPEADLSLTKTASAGPVLPGNDITYTITVANAGPDAAQAVAMTDDVPLNTTFVSDAQTSGSPFTLTNPAVGGTGTITGTIATLANGASATFTVVVEVPPTAPDATIITNTADVFSTVTSDPNLANNTQTVTTDVAAEADLSLTKTASAGPVLPGDDITYTITVANAGPAPAQAVAMTDDVPLNTTFVSDAQTSGPPFTLTNPAVGGTGAITGTIATLANGASATFTVIVMVLPITPDGTMITNTADVLSTVTHDPNLANNTQTVTTHVGTNADVTVTKTAAAGPVLAGNDITYTITVVNTGPSGAQTVALTDPLPADTTFVSDTQTTGLPFTMTGPAVGGTGTISDTIATLPLGDSASFTVVVLVSPSTPDLTAITNTATVTSTTSTNSASATNGVTQSADVTVTKTSAAGPVIAGDDITYTITVSNTGPSDAQTVALTDPLPADTTFVSDTQHTGLPFTLTGPAVGDTGTISDTIATLPLGDSATFTVVLLVSPSTPNLTTITNTATVTSSTSTNSASATNAVTGVTPAMPSVVDVQRFGFHDQATDLVVFFSTPLAAAQAQDVSNYRIVTLGGPGRGGSLIGHVTRVRKAVYNAAAGTVTLYMAHRLDIHNRYRFTIAGAAPDGLMGTDGVHLDGAANGIAGSDYVSYITEKTLAGRASEATRASLTSEFGVKKVAHAISASAVDLLAVSGQLASRSASAHH